MQRLLLRSLPTEGRGGFSGILQEGYAFGSILASAAFALLFAGTQWHGMTILPAIGWRGLFMLGASPALLVFYVQARVEESPVWLAADRKRRSDPPGESYAKKIASLKSFVPTFLFLIVLMTAFMSFSHGTQDVYPTFLQMQIGLSPSVVGTIGVIYGCAQIAGGFVFGTLSEKWGRKRAIITAALLSLLAIPAWAYGHSAVTLAIGAVVMQFMVQGAWGVVPAYLAELTPAAGARDCAGTGLSAWRTGDFVECECAGAGGRKVGQLFECTGDYGGDCSAGTGAVGFAGA